MDLGESEREMVFAKMVGMRAAAARNERGLSQEQVASRSGLSVVTIYRLENGKGSPSLSTIWRYAGVLGCSVKSLMPLLLAAVMTISGCSTSRPRAGMVSDDSPVGVVVVKPERCNRCGGEIPVRMWQFGDWASDGPSIYHLACAMPEDPEDCDYVGYIR